MANNDKINLFEDIGLVLIGILLAVTVIPLILGILIAVLIGASGLTYFTIVLGIAIILWFILGVVIYQ